jgi:hypothetical protein
MSLLVAMDQFLSSAELVLLHGDVVFLGTIDPILFRELS